METSSCILASRILDRSGSAVIQTIAHINNSMVNRNIDPMSDLVFITIKLTLVIFILNK